MRTHITFASLLCVALALGGCGEQHAYTVHMEKAVDFGDVLLPYQRMVNLNCALKTNNGVHSESQVVDVPSYTRFTGYSIACISQPQNSSLFLKMTVTRDDGVVIGTSEAATLYGVVSVAGN